ncbi:MAG TPA: right-handed parallel beta-helix repeat-containing protein, partial [Planctomycetota bacterium]|nr:right-handed parallel beta-helix repeat-containing protein [Planctomycetota bacterium]
KPFRAFDCLIADNIGIGLHLPGNGEVERCTFSGNTGEGLIFGGGVSSPPVTDCRFLGNGAGSQVVGIGFDDEGFAAVLGCTFVHDHLYIHGGLFGTTSITNCTFDGSTINPTGQELTMRNSIVRGVPSPFLGPEAVTISYSNIQNGWPGVGNIDAHPKWIDGPAGDYGLAPSSPCINTGDPAGPIDADGSPADMGAVPYDPWTELGVGIAGVAGLPGLNGRGPLLAGSEVLLTLSGTATAQLATLVVGTSALHAPFKGGTLWPAANLVIPGLLTGDAGGFTLSAQWPAGVPGATSVWMQFWIQDGAAVQGFAASNGLRATTP